MLLLAHILCWCSLQWLTGWADRVRGYVLTLTPVADGLSWPRQAVGSVWSLSLTILSSLFHVFVSFRSIISHFHLSSLSFSPSLSSLIIFSLIFSPSSSPSHHLTSWSPFIIFSKYLPYVVSSQHLPSLSPLIISCWRYHQIPLSHWWFCIKYYKLNKVCLTLRFLTNITSSYHQSCYF